MALRLRRGTDLERQSVIFAEGELVYVTDTKVLWVGDGQTLGGVKIAGGVEESPIALTQNLDLNGFDIVGAGDIDITGVVVASNFVGDGSGLFNLPVLDVVAGGNYQINIIGADSSVLVNSETSVITGDLYGTVYDVNSNILVNPINGTHYGNFSGDGSGLYNLPNLPEGSDQRISIVGADSTVMVDYATSSFVGNLRGSILDINENVILNSSTGVFSSIIDTPHTINVSTNSVDDASLMLTHPISNTSGSKIHIRGHGGTPSVPTVPNNFDRQGIYFEFYNGVDYSPEVALISYHQTSGAGYAGLTVSDSSGNFFGTALEMDGLTNRTSIVGGFTVSKYFKPGVLTTTERNAITPENGMIVYNSTVNKFQGYQNGAWINLDDGTAG